MVRRVVSDLGIATQVIAVPTIREPDGLALSSRNVYLSAEERRQALALSAGLAAAGATYQGLFRNPLVSPDILVNVDSDVR